MGTAGPVGDLEALDRQRAFTALLGRPVVDREGDPLLWPLVRRHWPILTEWFSARLGYRLVVSDHAARLYRLPAAGVVVAPRPVRPPPRRAMVLALLAAAAAEDTEDVTTVQELSDRVRALSARPDVPVAGYDPDRYSERSVFVKAVELLGELGALHLVGRGDSEQMLSGWARRQNALGGVYEVDRELLLRLVEPSCLVAALRGAVPGGGGGRPAAGGLSAGARGDRADPSARRHAPAARTAGLSLRRPVRGRTAVPEPPARAAARLVPRDDRMDGGGAGRGHRARFRAISAAAVRTWRSQPCAPTTSGRSCCSTPCSR